VYVVAEAAAEVTVAMIVVLSTIISSIVVFSSTFIRELWEPFDIHVPHKATTDIFHGFANSLGTWNYKYNSGNFKHLFW